MYDDEKLADELAFCSTDVSRVPEELRPLLIETLEAFIARIEAQPILAESWLGLKLARVRIRLQEIVKALRDQPPHEPTSGDLPPEPMPPMAMGAHVA